MQSLEQQSAEDFRDTPYGRQLLLGFRRLLFVPDLEREFRRYLHRQARLAQRLGAFLLIIVVSGYLYAERHLLALPDAGWLRELTLLRLLEMLPGIAVLAISLFHRRLRVAANRLFPLFLVMVGTVAARIDIQYEIMQPAMAFRYGAGLLIVCSFFFLGITFWRALASASAIVLIDVLMAALILSSDEMRVHWISVS